MTWETSLIPVVLIVTGLLMIAVSFILTTTRTTSSGDMWMGQLGSEHSGYTAANMILAIVGAFIFASGLMYAFLREEYEPLQSPMGASFPAGAPLAMGAPYGKTSEPVLRIDREEVQKDSEILSAPLRSRTITSPSTSSSASPDDGHSEAVYLTLRLLNGDERSMFRAIMDSGGEALQKDLIPRTKMSDAKVSRVLDRLEEKGVVSKERYGMTNKVRIDIEPR